MFTSTTHWQRALLLIGLAITLAACAGQVAAPTATPPFLDTVVPSPTIVLSPTPDCSATDRAKQAVQQFFSLYNAGQLNPVIGQLAPNFREYLDTFDGFMVTGDHMPDIRIHFQQMFALHDHFAAADADFHINAEPPGSVPGYNVVVSNVERTNDRLKANGKTQHGEIQIGIYCDTLQLSIIGIKING
ncbi:MAG: hypothetical protein ACYDEO_14020 [Aggregatilineales bacterium]